MINILKGVFNGAVWSFILWVFMCIIASVATWSNYFTVSFSDWGSAFRLLFVMISALVFFICVKGGRLLISKVDLLLIVLCVVIVGLIGRWKYIVHADSKATRYEICVLKYKLSKFETLQGDYCKEFRVVLKSSNFKESK